MEALLHWDFSPGLAVEAQVRRRFGSRVHFSPSSGDKEFFLVVSFSSASFFLSEESVGLALQSCIGGDHLGFRVFQLSDKRFRFSVASNRVGHFIYGLRDRVWPDFVCHFSLFRGVHPAITGFHQEVFPSWNANAEILEVPQRAKTALKPNLDFLKPSAATDSSSAKELSKFDFGIQNSSSLGIRFGSFDSIVEPAVHSDGIIFGSFSNPVRPNNQGSAPRTFYNHKFLRNYCANLPKEMLENLEDLRQYRYSDQVIMEALNLPVIPPKDLVFEYLGRCSFCGLTDHLQPNCPGTCRNCILMGFQCVDCEVPPPPSAADIPVADPVACSMEKQETGPLDPFTDKSLSGPLRCCYRCLELGHIRRNCTNDIKCTECYGWGHKARFCPFRQICSFCHQTGHLLDLCPQIRCNTCHDLGHLTNQCHKHKKWVKKGTKEPIKEVILINNSDAAHIAEALLDPCTSAPHAAHVEDVELAGIALITRDTSTSLEFTREGGAVQNQMIPEFSCFPDFFGWLMRQVYTRTILSVDTGLYTAPYVHFISQLAGAVRAYMISWVFNARAPAAFVLPAVINFAQGNNLLAPSPISSVVIEEIVSTNDSTEPGDDGLPDINSLVNYDLGFVSETNPGQLTNALGHVQFLVDHDSSSLSSAPSGPVTRARARKPETPKVAQQVRRSPRHTNNGFMHTCIPDRQPRRRSSSVPKAMPPDVLQVAEMQRIGVEECNIDPKELTEARLHQDRST